MKSYEMLSEEMNLTSFGVACVCRSPNIKQLGRLLRTLVDIDMTRQFGYKHFTFKLF